MGACLGTAGMAQAGESSTNCPLSPSLHPPKLRAHLHLHTPSSALLCPWIELSCRIKEQSWDSFHTEHRLGLPAVGDQSCVCPCWPHLIQSKHSPRSAVPAPEPSHHTPHQLSSLSNFFQLCTKCLCSKIPGKSLSFFFSPLELALKLEGKTFLSGQREGIYVPNAFKIGTSNFMILPLKQWILFSLYKIWSNFPCPHSCSLSYSWVWGGWVSINQAMHSFLR